MICRICQNQTSKIEEANQRRTFYYCDNCGLIFVPEENWISIEEEKERYEKHNNTSENKGYVKYLGQIAEIVGKLKKTSPRILDFGSGKSAVLTGILEENGFDCTAYDPLFDINTDINGQLFDIIILCEVIEHLRNITGELARIKRLLKTDGILIIRTRLYPSKVKIAEWWYAQDKTHINLFSRRTIEEVAGKLERFKVTSEAEDIFVIG